ncbi:MAG: FeoB-associated Cys-rich membrane protein [Desulfobacterales bacterium]|jgi:hypothetical protein
MEEVAVGIIVGVAVIYLVKRYWRIFRPRAQDVCGCECSDCGQEATCDSEIKTIQPHSK